MISSSTAQQSSFVRPGDPNSLFTLYLLEALEGRASIPGRSAVSINEVFEYVSENVATSAKASHQEQTPWISLEGTSFHIALLCGGKGVPADQLLPGQDTTRSTVHLPMHGAENETDDAYTLLYKLTSGELDRFLETYYRNVSKNMTDGMAKDQKINKFVKECNDKGILSEMLGKLRIFITRP